MTLSSNRPHHSRRCYFVQQRPLLFNLALLGGNRPNQDPEDRFGYDVRNRIPDLLAGSRCHTGDPEHLDDVHEGIGQPGDDREPTSVSRERRDRWCLLLRGFTQPDRQLRHNVEKRNHGKEPPHPPAARAVLDLARIPESHHHRRGHTQRPALAHCFRRWQAHHEDQLDEEQRDSQDPVDVPEGIIPGVEDAEVVVGRDEGHEAGDRERRAVLLAHVVDLQPEEDRRTSHTRDAERESVVHRTPASVVPTVHERRHGFSGGQREKRV